MPTSSNEIERTSTIPAGRTIQANEMRLARLRDNTKRLEESSYASASVYGCSSIDTLLPLVTARIENTTNKLHKGAAGRSFAEIKQYLADVEPLAAAAIALKVTFDKVFSSVDGSNKLQNVTGAIGHCR